MSWLSRLTNVFRPARVTRDLDDELAYHREARLESLMRDGLSREAAEAEVSRRFGSALRHRETSQEIKLLPWLDAIGRDIRLGLRMLAKDRLVTGAAIASLALGLGACAAAFSLVEALILRPLPVRDPARLVLLTSPADEPDRPERETFGYPLFDRLRDASRAQVELFAMSTQVLRTATFSDAAGEPERVRGQHVSGTAFEILGVRPAAGRLLAPYDDLRPGEHPVAVLSHAFWQRRFGGDPAVIGRTFTLEGAFTVDKKPYEIVGVAEPRFTGIEPGRQTDVWVPAMMYDANALTQMGWGWLRIFGRLKPGIEAAQAEPVLDTTFRAIRAAQKFPPHVPPEEIKRYLATPAHVRSAATGASPLRREFARPLWTLAVVVGLVLLIAGSNIANLFFARAAARGREMSLRLSIGASRGRLIQQVLIESALLAAAASALALLFASAAGPLVVRMLAPASDPAYLDLRLTWRLAAFVAAAGLVSMALFGLAPALRASSVAPMGALRGDGGGSSTRASTGRHLPRPLVALQIGFSLTILFVAGLLVTSFGKLIASDPGFTSTNLLLVSIDTKGVGTPEQVRVVAPQVRDHLRRVPGVESVGASAWPLLAGGSWTSIIRLPGRAPDLFELHYLEVSPGFFDAMRIRLRDGRDFEARDAEPGRPTTVIVNEAFARRYFGTTASGPSGTSSGSAPGTASGAFSGASGRRAVGAVFERPTAQGPVRQEIVGVVTDAKYASLRDAAPPTVYVPLRNMGTLLVRTAGDPARLIPTVRREVQAVHPSLRIGEIGLQSTLIDNALIRERLLALLSGFFAVVGLLLAAIGLYGVLNYTVVRRTREIGIRVALGARPSTVVRWVLADVALTTLVGIAGGLAGGVLLARYVETLLYEVRPLDPTSVGLPIACLIGAGLLAAWPAARRAARVDPVVALRAE